MKNFTSARWLVAAAVLALAFLLPFAAFGSIWGTPAWSDIERLIQRQWPAVASISAGQLARMESPVLVDVRSREEFEVSHLPGAVWAGDARVVDLLEREIPDSRAMVFYCSVGVRSTRTADRVRRRSRQLVYNLEGSIFRWANEGRPVVRDGREVSQVHPFNSKWGVLLRRDLWAWK